MSVLARWLPSLALTSALVFVVGWPAVATVIEAVRSLSAGESSQAGLGTALDAAGSANVLREEHGLARPARLALETVGLVAATELLAVPLGVAVAILLFRTDIPGRLFYVGLVMVAAFVPLPLHATAWLGAFGNAGRSQALGVEPILVGRMGAAVVHALASLPWVVLITGVGLAAVEPELEETARLDAPFRFVLIRVTLRRAVAAIAAAMLAVAVLTAGDMTITDLLQIRTYAEEAYLQFMLGNGPGDAALVTIPPLLVFGALILIAGGALDRLDPLRLISSFDRARIWSLGPWRLAAGAVMAMLVGNLFALPIYSLIWRAGRVGGRATLGQPPQWSLAGLLGTLRFAALEIAEPLGWSLIWTVLAATAATALAGSLAWACRRSMGWRVVAFATLAITLAAPGPVAGMALVLAYRDLRSIYSSPIMVVLAETVRSLPYALLFLWPFLRSFPQEYLDAAALEGLGPRAQVMRVLLPLSARALVAAWAIAFAIGLSELPATNLATPPGVPPMSVVIWSLLHTGVESHLAGVALLMLLVVAAAGLFATGTLWSLRSARYARSSGQ